MEKINNYKKELEKSIKYIEKIKDSLINYYNSIGLLCDNIYIKESKNEYNFFLVAEKNKNIFFTSKRINNFEDLQKHVDIIVNNFYRFANDLYNKNLI